MTLRGSARRMTAALAAVIFAFGLSAAPALAAAKGQWSFTTLNVAKAWAVTRGAGVTVAVLDSGVVATVGDLGGRLLPGVDLSSGNAQGNGQADPGEACTGPGGCYSHGTDLALNVAGTGAGAGFVGIAPQASILPVKVTARSGDAPDPDVIAQGIRWAVDHGAQVIAVGVGTQELCPAVEDEAGKYAYEHGVPIVVAAGDTGQDVNSPAGCYGAMGVTANDIDFKPWSKGNFGFTATFSAPGVDIASETINGTIRQGTSGTGSAAGIVAGTFALVRAHYPTLGERDLITRVLWNVHNGAAKFAHLIDERVGYGEVLPYYALTFKLPALASLANPIFDSWKKDLGPPATTGAPAESPGSSVPGQSPVASNDVPSGPTNGAITVDSQSGSDSGTSTGVVVGIVAAVIVVVGAGVFLAARSRRGRREGAR
jgi:hypothetical protein